MKPTRTDDNKTSRSTPFRKWSIPQEEIKKIAKELTKVPEVIQEAQAPKIKCERKPVEPIVSPWNYEAYAAALQAIIDENETVTVSKQSLLNIFPQNKRAYRIVENLKLTYWLNYRYSDANGWEYVFFDGETKNETIERMDKEMENIIREKNTIVVENYNLKNKLQTMQDANNQTYTALLELEKLHTRKKEENSQLQSDLSNTEGQRNQSLLLAILLFIYILISNYYG